MKKLIIKEGSTTAEGETYKRNDPGVFRNYFFVKESIILKKKYLFLKTKSSNACSCKLKIDNDKVCVRYNTLLTSLKFIFIFFFSVMVQSATIQKKAERSKYYTSILTQRAININKYSTSHNVTSCFYIRFFK